MTVLLRVLLRNKFLACLYDTRFFVHVSTILSVFYLSYYTINYCIDVHVLCIDVCTCIDVHVLCMYICIVVFVLY